MILLLSYIIIINTVSFHLYRIDKKRAEHGEFRIPEYILLGVAFLGGALGAYCAMHEYRHKTLHTAFTIGVPIALAVWTILVAWTIIHCFVTL